MRREDVFARDDFRCVYCGEVHPVEELTADHVQARVRGGDRSAGNLVTACRRCNVDKGHRTLTEYLLDEPAARESFLRWATHVWPRHLRALEEELRHRAREREQQRRRGSGRGGGGSA